MGEWKRMCARNLNDEFSGRVLLAKEAAGAKVWLHIEGTQEQGA
jgi:hypothetical protein